MEIQVTKPRPTSLIGPGTLQDLSTTKFLEILGDYPVGSILVIGEARAEVYLQFEDTGGSRVALWLMDESGPWAMADFGEPYLSYTP